MSGLLMLLGSLLIFANPEVRLDAVSPHWNQTSAFQGASGLGGSLYGHYRDNRAMRHSLNLRAYENGNYRSTTYSLGVDALLPLQQSPIELAVGIELGSSDLRYQDGSGSESERLGGDLHAEVAQYFTVGDTLLYGFVRPAWQFYEFDAVSGTGPSLSFGIGSRF